MVVSFVFLGRVIHEKGITALLEAVTVLLAQGKTNFVVDIIWDGSMVDDVFHHPAYASHIFYHWRLPKEQAMQRLSRAHYLLMPSLFLETFWLSALDALAYGIPVIGEKKWGLIPFIIDPLFEIISTHSLVLCMQEVLEVDTAAYATFHHQALKTASQYTPQKRLDRFRQLSKNCKTCLLVSDYATDIWWLENFLLQVQDLLHKDGVETAFRWKTKRTTWWRRKLDLLVSWVNLWWARQVFDLLRKTRYDLVWIHSIQRRIGWLWVWLVYMSKKQPVRVMYHDFWLFHPFPSGVFTEDNLQQAKTFVGYLAEGKYALWPLKRWIGGRLLVITKYVYTKWLWYRLRKTADIHLVPSPYLTPYVRHWLGKEYPLQVFPHFVSHTHDG